MDLSRERDPEILRQAALILERENERLVKRALELQREIERLKGSDPEALVLKLQILEEQLSRSRQEMFGRSSEKLAREAASLPDRKPQKGHGPTPQPELPIVEQVHLLDEADRTCPKCGGDLQVWENQYEESDEITVIERKFHITRHKRQKYRCSCQSCVETAPGPLKLFDGARYSIDFAVDVAVAKYADHSPLERQVKMMEREGLKTTSQSLWDQTHALYQVLNSLGDRIHQAVLSSPVVFADETPWRMLVKKEGGNWYIWGVASDKLACYRAFDSRSKKAAEDLLSGYRGTVVADGYSAYGSLARDGPVTLAGCWTHARRYFFEAKDNYPAECGWFLEKIGELYAAEGLVPAGDNLELRRKLREERSWAVVDEIHRHATSLISDLRTLRGSGLFKALQYLLNQWGPLTVFLGEPNVPLDNNAAERALRGVVLGRKNHLGSKSSRGASVTAFFYTIMESCKLCGIDPRQYLRNAACAYLTGHGDTFPLPGHLPPESTTA